MDKVGKSPLHTMTLMSSTEFWNDSCSVADLTYAIDNGATGILNGTFAGYTSLHAGPSDPPYNYCTFIGQCQMTDTPFERRSFVIGWLP